MKQKEKLYLIIEEPYKTKPSIIEDKSEEVFESELIDFEILTENYSPISKSSKLSFRAIVQESNTLNKNGRYYPPEVLQEAVEFFRNEIARRGGLPAEVDHPFVESSDPQVIKRRASQIFIKEVGVLYKDIKFDGNKVIVEGITLDNPKGQMVYSLIKEGYNVGFSLRAFGKIVPINENGQSYLLVEKLEKPITYDVVINPSHQSARLIEIQENELNVSSNLELLTESVVPYEKSSIIIPSIVIPPNVTNDETVADEDLKQYIAALTSDDNVLKIQVNIDGDITTVCVNDQFCKITRTDDFIKELVSKYVDSLQKAVDNTFNDIVSGYITPVPVIQPRPICLNDLIARYYDIPPIASIDEDDIDIDESYTTYIDELIFEMLDQDIDRVNQLMEFVNRKIGDIDIDDIPPHLLEEFLYLAFDIPEDKFDELLEIRDDLEAIFDLSEIERQLIKEETKDEYDFDDELEPYLNNVDNRIVENILKEVELLVYKRLTDEFNEYFKKMVMVENKSEKEEITEKLSTIITEAPEKLIDYMLIENIDTEELEFYDNDMDLYIIFTSELF